MTTEAAGHDPLISQVLGHYRVIEKIGSGGMGVVYRAQDEHLQREVAIKVLPLGTLADEPARRRFRNEALALSKLNHPNIATIHDFDTQQGLDFLVMEYIPGITLDEKLADGSLPEKQVIAHAVQLAEGLSAAHEHAVVHRDLKPGNLRITTDGRLKILDFGLAKLRASVAASSVSETLSETRAIVGTLPYMAPEQVLGGEVDARTDIHAAGAVLHEMATGQRAFPAVDRALLTSAILRSSPQPASNLNPSLSPELSRIISKCLEKEPESRFQSAKELAIDLRRLQSGAVSGIQPKEATPQRSFVKILGLSLVGFASLLGILLAFNIAGVRERLLGSSNTPRVDSLAVLPLANLSGDPQQEYFTDGMTEALIAELSQINSLKVISRTSVMRYKGSGKSLPQIARELSVDGVIEGSVLRSGDQVRITAQLIYAPSDTHLWAKSYERGIHDVLRLQGEVAQAITSEIKAKVTPNERARLAQARTVDPKAYELYLKGRYEWNKRSAEGLNKGKDYFQQAINLDPTYALAYAGLADSYSMLANNSILPGREVYPEAKAAALRALQLDETRAEVHAALAPVLADYERNWDGALNELRTAIQLNPNYATAHHWYGMRLAEVGKNEEAVREIEQARTLDPLSVRISANVALILYFGGHYDQAITEAHKALELEPTDDGTHTRLGDIYLQKGMMEQALAEFRAPYGADKVSRAEEMVDPYMARAYALSGNRAEALRQLRELESHSAKEYVSPYLLARVCVGLHENEEALAWLQKGFAEYAGGMDWMKVDPALDPLRSEPRFKDLMRRMNFPD